MEARFQLGVGIRFKPTEEELIKCFLLKRVRGQALSPCPIGECELYGKRSPWEIFEERANNSDKSVWYCFTSLKKTGKKRISRVAGKGTWHGESSAKEIVDSKKKNAVIGFKKTFTFKVKGKNSDWNMDEFRLADDEECSDYVLCKIKKKKPKAVEEEQAEEMASELAATNTVNNFVVESHQSCSQLFVPPSSLSVCDNINVGEQCYGMKNLPDQDEIINSNGLIPPVSETTEKATNVIDDDDWSAMLEEYLQQEKSLASYR